MKFALDQTRSISRHIPTPEYFKSRNCLRDAVPNCCTSKYQRSVTGGGSLPPKIWLLVEGQILGRRAFR